MDEKRRIWEEMAKKMTRSEKHAGPCEVSFATVLAEATLDNPGVLTPSNGSLIAVIALVTQSNYACDVSNISAILLQQYTDPTPVLRSGKVTQANTSIVIQDNEG